MGELHLEIIVDRLLREFKVEANVGAPQVAYKETMTKAVDVDSKYASSLVVVDSTVTVKYTSHRWIRTAKRHSSSLLRCRRCYSEGIHSGCRRRYRRGYKGGILGGFPVLGVAADVYDGSYHEVDSSEMAFHIAGSMAFKDAMAKGNPVLLEPIMKVEVTMPEEYMGDVIGDVNARRGRIEGMEDIGGGKMVKAYVPLAEMFGYSTDLRSRTQGRGNYSMFFEKYEQVPKSVQEKIIAERKGAAK